MMKLQHSNVVKNIGVCYLEDSTHPVFVMEKMETSLDEILQRPCNLPFSPKESLLADVARGLVYLHSHNPPIVHWNLTARNVLVNFEPSLVAKICHVNIMNLLPGKLARNHKDLPATTVYMPPEAFDEGSQCGPQLDIFSFGNLALFTLTQVRKYTFLLSLLVH